MDTPFEDLEGEEDDPGNNLRLHEFLLRVVCWSDQPEAFIVNAAASGAGTMLEGWTEHPQVTIERISEVGLN